ncbi:hypothetical protein KBD59_00250 [Candidatus Gracilibacteria bacterium]|nr:hypothetical protein [Candidatus Gracilibacteria bacterium]
MKTLRRVLTLCALTSVAVAIPLGATAQAQQVTVPASPYSNIAGQVLRDVTGGAVVIQPGGNISLGSTTPNGAPGAATQPVPRFSAINAPIWINQNGPAQVGDDLMVQGLGDFRMGITNTTPGVPGAVNPLRIYDEVEIIGNNNESGNLRVTGGLSVSGQSNGNAGAVPNRITGDLTLRGAVNLSLGSDLLLSSGSLLSGPGTMVIGAADGSSRHQITGSLNLLGSMQTSGTLEVTQDWVRVEGSALNRQVAGVGVTNGTISGNNANLELLGGDTGGANVIIGTEGTNNDSNRVRIFAQTALLDAKNSLDIISASTHITSNVVIQESNNATNVRIDNGMVTTTSDVNVGRNLTVGTTNGGFVTIGRAADNGVKRLNEINMYAGNIYMLSEKGLHVEGGNSSIDGTLDVDDITVQSMTANSISAGSIGTFYSVTSGASAVLPAGASTAWSAPVTRDCTAGDKLLSCSVVFDDDTPPANGLWYIRPVDGQQRCSLMTKRIIAQAGTFNARPRAQCFSPDIPQQQ